MTDFALPGHSTLTQVTSTAAVLEPSSVSPVPVRRLAASPDFDTLYDLHFEFIWRSLRRLGVPRASLDDATQDVFVVAFRRLSDFANRSSPKTWLAGIAVKVAADCRRRLRRKGGLEPLSDSLEDGRPGPDARTAVTEALRRLDAVLVCLDDGQREVFVLAELEGMTAPEIAEATATNLNTVYSRLRAARSAFDESLRRLQRGDR